MAELAGGNHRPVATGRTPGKHTALLTGELEVSELDLMLAGTQLDLTTTFRVAAGSPAIDHFLATDLQESAIIRGDIEGVGAILGCGDGTAPAGNETVTELESVETGLRLGKIHLGVDTYEPWLFPGGNVGRNSHAIT